MLQMFLSARMVTPSRPLLKEKHGWQRPLNSRQYCCSAGKTPFFSIAPEQSPYEGPGFQAFELVLSFISGIRVSQQLERKDPRLM